MPDRRQKSGDSPLKDEIHLHPECGWQQAGVQIGCFVGYMQNLCEKVVQRIRQPDRI